MLVQFKRMGWEGAVALMRSVAEGNKETVQAFWHAMQSNDFRAAGELLADEFVLEWPQSGERIRGRDNFALVNEHYPTVGRWAFTVHRLVAEEKTVVTDVTVTDGVTSGRAVTFSTVRDGKIVHQVEYWPDPFDAPEWRSAWVERAERAGEDKGDGLDGQFVWI